MRKPYRRAFELYLIINLLLIFSVALPIAAVLNHYHLNASNPGHYGPIYFSRSDLSGFFGMWSVLGGGQAVITLAFAPGLAAWLARQDAERESRRAARREEQSDRKHKDADAVQKKMKG